MKPVLLLAAASLAGGVLTQAWAREVPTPAETAQLMKLDSNGDGEISKAEAAADAKVMKNWDRMDANRNGYLDAAEIAMMVEVGDAAED